MPFAFEKLIVYQKTLDWAATIDELIDTCGLSRTHAIADQLSRASISISLNIAEGNGRFHPKEKTHFFHIARGSLLECVALIQILKKKGLLDSAAYGRNYSALEEIAKMLAGLIQSVPRAHVATTPN